MCPLSSLQPDIKKYIKKDLKKDLKKLHKHKDVNASLDSTTYEAFNHSASDMSEIALRFRVVRCFQIP